MFIRNLLLHNGTSASAILEHSHQLLRPGGHLFCVEADITRLQFLNAASEERDLELCWGQIPNPWATIRPWAREADWPT